ncbi:hypothetical protein SAY86_015623 [Trapa natans]|uniref:Uncharacterized protein n=1 Tax=Trapa natans TaxID=22666 RepID=A0AAN7LIU5_TRANT|nr:hypothetical protein SAY86_015623 [Trapa natans]
MSMCCSSIVPGSPAGGIIARVALAAFAFIFFCAISAYRVFKRMEKSKQENFYFRQISIGADLMGLNFKDIKSSNVLPYENFSPKIADFGLARCFETNLSHFSSRIAWTFLSEAVDASLEGDCPREEATHVLKIGLLCTQASAGDRPTMHQVLEMLMYSSSKIPEPNQPPFLNARAMDLQSTSRSHSTNN